MTTAIHINSNEYSYRRDDASMAITMIQAFIGIPTFTAIALASMLYPQYLVGVTLFSLSAAFIGYFYIKNILIKNSLVTLSGICTLITIIFMAIQSSNTINIHQSTTYNINGYIATLTPNNIVPNYWSQGIIYPYLVNKVSDHRTLHVTISMKNTPSNTHQTTPKTKYIDVFVNNYRNPNVMKAILEKNIPTLIKQ